MTDTVHRPLMMDAVRIEVPGSGERREFKGIHAEEEADAWLRRHVQENVAWEWAVEIEVWFEQEFAVEVDHRVRPGHTNGSVRDAVVAYFIGLSRDESRSDDVRTAAHGLAHWVQGEPLPAPVMRRGRDWNNRRPTLKPSPHVYHSEVSGIEAPSDTRRPFQRTH